MFLTSDIKYLIKSRTDPRRYLKRPIPNPEKTLEVNLTVDAFLGGSRAADFFVPGAASKSSDWEFFVPSTGTGRQSYGKATTTVPPKAHGRRARGTC